MAHPNAHLHTVNPSQEQFPTLQTKLAAKLQIKLPIKLQILNQIPDGLLNLAPHQLGDFLHQPTLIHLSGQKEPPLFVSVLLHGNETTGWLAMRELLQKYQDQPLPRSLSLFIGNISAARSGLRHFPDQPDYNRIWLGQTNAEEQITPEAVMAQEVMQEMKSRGVFASIDIHNNTGRNPHYACITQLDSQSRFLARSFAPLAVYYTTPITTQAYAFAKLCPAVILEAGQPNLADGTDHVLEFVEKILHLAEIPAQPVPDLALFHTVAVLKVAEGINFRFGNQTNQPADQASTTLMFPEAMDQLNFCELPQGTVLGIIENKLEDGSNSGEIPLLAWDESGNNQSQRFLVRVGNEIRLRETLMPAMITLNCDIVRSDCLCYLMERHS